MMNQNIKKLMLIYLNMFIMLSYNKLSQINLFKGKYSNAVVTQIKN
jgi:hypothetical protein